jgi:hypothetical protein
MPGRRRAQLSREWLRCPGEDARSPPASRAEALPAVGPGRERASSRWPGMGGEPSRGARDGPGSGSRARRAAGLTRFPLSLPSLRTDRLS